ncbi:MAG: DUF4843 domain-containing protein [Bacteroidaceae bacterium]|nr:DUF4843 domain-containing protein [Bacteroidaceae bacterium]
MKKYLFVLLSAAVGLASCSKDEISGWVGTDYVRIVGPEVWTLGSDSMEYSFAAYASAVTTFTVEARVYVEGANADVERTVWVKVDDATTAPADSYSLNEAVTIPAGQGYGTLDITLHRIPALETEKCVLKVALDDGRNALKGGVKDWQTLTVRFSDIISRPKNWGDLEEFFGATYSDTKYRFIINTLGFGSFTYLEPGGMSWGEMWNYRLLVVGALGDYNAAHPGNPLTDESGRPVSFDN